MSWTFESFRLIQTIFFYIYLIYSRNSEKILLVRDILIVLEFLTKLHLITVKYAGSNVNYAMSTFDGVDVMGNRLVEEVGQSNPLTYFS